MRASKQKSPGRIATRAIHYQTDRAQYQLPAFGNGEYAGAS